jgi:NTP pyrophosphatase (non-canonical NTP hydrolase)
MSLDLHYLIEKSHATAVDKGWWDKERSAGDIFANIHAEVSEAWECYRIGDAWDSIYFDNEKPEGIAVELADVLIRIFDLCAAKNIPLEEALCVKMVYNTKRPYRHGNKLA